MFRRDAAIGKRPNPAVSAALLFAAFVLLLVAERRSPLRVARESPQTRFARNGVFGALALAATGLLETPLVMRVAAAGERHEWGLLRRLPLPRALRTVGALLLLDYGMYVWHAALHRVPLLWRLHLVHHADRDLDVTTALRIHAIEIGLSVGVRIAQVLALGIAPADFALWQRLFACSILFQHANLKLPAAGENILGAVIVTPRRHGVHHLVDRSAQHGNWSSGLVVWDWLHGTLRAGDGAGDVGVPGYREEADVSLAKMLALPFVAQTDPWASA